MITPKSILKKRLPQSTIQVALNGYKESLKSALKNAIENQEDENREDFNAGAESAFNYALLMLDKHLSFNKTKCS